MSISPQSLGLQRVATPGTPQAFDTTLVTTKKWLLTPIKTLPSTANVGNIYIGTSSMSKSTGTGVYAILTPTSAPLVLERPQSSGEYFKSTEWYIDADNSTDGVLIGYYGE
jgi:hypothetical protein